MARPQRKEKERQYTKHRGLLKIVVKEDKRISDKLQKMKNLIPTQLPEHCVHFQKDIILPKLNKKTKAHQFTSPKTIVLNCDLPDIKKLNKTKEEQQGRSQTNKLTPLTA